MGCGCSVASKVCKHPGRRLVVSPQRQAQAAMLVAVGPKGWTVPKRTGPVRVHWLVRWAGTPAVLRPKLTDAGVAAHKLEGCGCIVPLKALWLRMLRRAMTWRTRRKLRAVLAKWRRTKRAVDRARRW